MCLIVLTVHAAPAARQGPSPKYFQALDTDHDGRISFTEFQPTGPPPLHPRMQQVFESLKPDAAGTLSFDDAAKVIATVSGVRPKMDPDLAGDFGTIPLHVHPQTKRAFVKVAIHGVEGVFLLDTGTSHTIIHPDFAKRAKVDFVEICQNITAGNMGKRGDFVSLVRVPEMSIGGARFRDFHGVLKSATKDRYEFGKPIDGILGASVIFAKPVTLDYRHQRMTYETMSEKEAKWMLPLIETGQPTPTVAADIDGVKVNLMFDSGAAINDAILINEPYHTAFRKLAGDSQAKTYIAKSVKVAGQEIDSHVRCLLNPFECTVVSSVFFDAHRITVDNTARKMWIKPQAKPE